MCFNGLEIIKNILHPILKRVHYFKVVKHIFGTQCSLSLSLSHTHTNTHKKTLLFTPEPQSCAVGFYFCFYQSNVLAYQSKFKKVLSHITASVKKQKDVESGKLFFRIFNRWRFSQQSISKFFTGISVTNFFSSAFEITFAGIISLSLSHALSLSFSQPYLLSLSHTLFYSFSFCLPFPIKHHPLSNHQIQFGFEYREQCLNTDEKNL